ncbi:MAG: hypothetical protein LBH10_03895 [Burkholderiaceae bacterium]|jgi:hypothetical protein|nr:hypothetical protein [Burkholderiaceae bacterium]
MTAFWQSCAKRLTSCLALVLPFVLSGCISKVNIAPGTPASQIIATLGQPTARYTLPGGGQRLQYSEGPMGQHVYNIDLDAQERAVDVVQALDETLFAKRILVNNWTREDVLREYGQPTHTMTVRNFDGEIWTWRYLDPLSQRYQLYIDIDRGGVVRSYSTVAESQLLGN